MRAQRRDWRQKAAGERGDRPVPPNVRIPAGPKNSRLTVFCHGGQRPPVTTQMGVLASGRRASHGGSFLRRSRNGMGSSDFRFLQERGPRFRDKSPSMAISARSIINGVESGDGTEVWSLSQNLAHRIGCLGSSAASPQYVTSGGGLRPTASHPRIRFWDRLLGSAYLWPALPSARAPRGLPCCVSILRSSSRTCGSPASGVRTRVPEFAHATLRSGRRSLTGPSSSCRYSFGSVPLHSHRGVHCESMKVSSAGTSR
jgi:hypothetical protein